LCGEVESLDVYILPAHVISDIELHKRIPGCEWAATILLDQISFFTSCALQGWVDNCVALGTVDAAELREVLVSAEPGGVLDALAAHYY